MGKWTRRLIIALALITGVPLLIFAIGYLAASGDYVVAATVADDPSLPHVTLEGVTFHAEAFGDPSHKTVVVLHGGPGDSYKYLLALKPLADVYHLVFYDQRGAGLSPRVEAEQLSLETSIEDLHRIVRHFGRGKKVHLIGHSWGGMLAVGYIERHPEMLEHVVLAEPGPLTGALGDEFVEMIGQPAMTLNNLGIIAGAYFESLHVDGPDDQASVDYMFTRIVTSPNVDDHPIAGYFCNNDVSTAVIENFRFGALASTAIREKGVGEDGKQHYDLTGGLRDFPNEILILAGSCNNIIGPAWQRRQQKFFTKSKLVIIEDAGHTMIGEKPEESLAAIRAYLATPLDVEPVSDTSAAAK